MKQEVLVTLLSNTKGCTVQTRSITTGPEHPETGDTFSHPNRIPDAPPPSVQQQL